MYDFAYGGIDLFKIRERLKKMTDDQLMAYGRSAAWMAERNEGDVWHMQLKEPRAEWRRRFKKPSNDQPGVDNDAKS